MACEILKLGAEAMILYLAWLLVIAINNADAINWKRATVVPIYGEDRSVVTNYGPVSLTSVVCKQMEHIIAGYLRQVWMQINGYTKANMNLDWDTPVTAEQS